MNSKQKRNLFITLGCLSAMAAAMVAGDYIEHHGETQEAPAAAAPAPRPRTIDDVKADIATLQREIATLKPKLAAQERAHPYFSLTGRIIDRDDNDREINVWGQALPESGGVNARGTLLGAGNITILHPNTERGVIAVGATFAGTGWFVQREEGRNSYGQAVPVFVYDAEMPYDLKVINDALQVRLTRLGEFEKQVAAGHP